MVALIVGWFVARKAALILYGVITAMVIAAAFGLVHYGKTVERAKCDSAAKQARIDALESDLANVTERMLREAAVAESLRRQAADDAVKIGDLATELATAKLQSTAPGAQTDANALLDDRCNYTPLGARRVRE